MLSLSLLIAVLVISILLPGLALTFSARALGSATTRIRTGLFAVILMTLVSIPFAIAYRIISPQNQFELIASALTLLVIQLLAIYYVLWRVFKLSRLRTLAQLAILFAVEAVLLVLSSCLFKPYVAEAFVLPTQSMAPTLVPGDHFVVNKLLSPRRWDLVAYHTNDENRTIYCKRLVGMPGERLMFKDGSILVNGEAIAAPPVVAGRYHATSKNAPAEMFRYRDGELIDLKSDEIFLIGDNVDSSADSRTNGPSKYADLVGTVDWIYWPLSKFSLLR